MLNSLNNNYNFYSSMSNVLNQWSDFRVSKNLYKEYFAMQQSEDASSSESYIQKLINGSTEKVYEDKLGSLSNAVSEAVSKLETAGGPTDTAPAGEPAEYPPPAPEFVQIHPGPRAHQETVHPPY